MQLGKAAKGREGARGRGRLKLQMQCKTESALCLYNATNTSLTQATINKLLLLLVLLLLLLWFLALRVMRNERAGRRSHVKQFINK